MTIDKSKILIVEDDAAVVESLRDGLTHLGYDVVGSVSTGEDAIRQTKEQKPDIVLMDIVLEGESDGIKASQELHSLFQVPVIFLTGYADEVTLERAKLTGPYGYIIKPFDLKSLKITIEIALHRREIEVGREKLIIELQDVIANMVRQYINIEKLSLDDKDWFF